MLENAVRHKIDEPLLRKLWPMRIPDKVLAERMGRYRGVIRRRAKKLGLPLRRALWGRRAA